MLNFFRPRTPKSSAEEQSLHVRRQVIEGIGKVGGIRRIAISEADIVGCSHMKVLGQLRNQVAVHVGRGRETVKEHNSGSILFSGFAVEHLVAMDVSVIVGSHAKLLSVSCAGLNTKSVATGVYE